VIVREVVFLAPMLGWKDPDRMAADVAFTFVCKHNLSAEKITAARLSSWLNDARDYQKGLRGYPPARVQQTHTTLPREDTSHSKTTPPTPTPVQGALCCDLDERDSGTVQAERSEGLISRNEDLAGNAQGSVTKPRRQIRPSQAAVLAAVSRRKGWVSLEKLAGELPGLSRKALLMTLGRLVTRGELDHQTGRSGKYRIARERKIPGPRKRKTRPFPVTTAGLERKTICRSELVVRGWSRDLIDALFPPKERNFAVQKLKKPGTTQTYMLAFYYDTSDVKEFEAQAWFELKRFDLRRRQRPIANVPQVPRRTETLVMELPYRRSHQKAIQAVESTVDGSSYTTDRCA
jgi:hypothetical protein